MGGHQERIDRRSHKRHPVIPSEEAIPSGMTKDRYYAKRTEIPELSLRIETGFNPRVSTTEIVDTLPDAIAFKQADALAKFHGGKREELRKKLVPKFKRHKGWMGIISPPDDLVLRADESVSVVYDGLLLRDSMTRDAHKEVVRRETVIVEFPLPKSVHPDVAVDIMIQAVADIGTRAARSAKITIKPDVDENELARRMNSGEIKKLKRGARKLKKRLNLTVGPFVKNPPKEKKDKRTPRQENEQA